MKLLSKIGANPKIRKSDKQGKHLTAILHLAPADESGYNVCPSASPGCKAACLNTAGRGQMSFVQKSRIARTRYYVEHRGEFLSQLEKEIAAFVRKCRRLKRKPCVRLNGTSDIMWERSGIIQKFPKVQFYDYTKIFARVTPEWNLPENYYLTFSMTESNLVKALDALAYGKNIAVVFAGKFPKSFLGYPVIDGTKHDLRFLDPKGVVVALKPLGKARRDTSGFVQQQKTQGDSNGQSDQRATRKVRETDEANR